MGQPQPPAEDEDVAREAAADVDAGRRTRPGGGRLPVVAPQARPRPLHRRRAGVVRPEEVLVGEAGRPLPAAAAGGPSRGGTAGRRAAGRLGGESLRRRMDKDWRQKQWQEAPGSAEDHCGRTF